MTIGLYRPTLSRPAAVHGQCGSWRYMPVRDAVTRSAAQSRPVTCTSLGGIGPQFLFHKLLASLKTPEEDHNGHQGFATLAIDRNVLVNFFVYKVTKSNNALLET
ncbi:hypothetical protein F2Q68_00026682 [Brassica cretica]|uniref:Uncharacterized protein n=1 Tax=Brassica cretica TaxID=69181 RepID=A0A8S9I9A9_BRACR|nr:hypothetical protein F2Q68_00026682 [Brassica cretica]